MLALARQIKKLEAIAPDHANALVLVVMPAGYRMTSEDEALVARTVPQGGCGLVVRCGSEATA